MIVDLEGRRVGGEPPINTELIKELETSLEQAKAGVIVAGCYAFVYDNDSASEGWSITTQGDAEALLPRLEILKHKLVEIVIENEDEDPPFDDPA
jgi:hypothetical protein